MIRIFRSLMAVFLVFILLFCFSMKGDALLINEEVSEEEALFSYNANMRYDALLKQWNNEYPDYYGGAYIENMKLYILVTCDPKSVKDDIILITGKDTSFKHVEYSYKRLCEYKDQIWNIIEDYRNNHEDLFDSCFGIGIDERKNTIFLETYAVSKKHVRAIKKLTNRIFKALEFRELEAPYTEEQMLLQE